MTDTENLDAERYRQEGEAQRVSALRGLRIAARKRNIGDARVAAFELAVAEGEIRHGQVRQDE